jgi:hypothetical protein
VEAFYLRGPLQEILETSILTLVLLPLSMDPRQQAAIRVGELAQFSRVPMELLELLELLVLMEEQS